MSWIPFCIISGSWSSSRGEWMEYPYGGAGTKAGTDDALGNAEYRTWGGFCQFFSMANQRDGFGNHDKNTCRGYGHSREGTRAESISKNSDKKLLCYEINGNKRKRQNILDFQQGRYVLSLFYSVAKIEINRLLLPFPWSIRDSNPWPPQCECGALPTALIPHTKIISRKNRISSMYLDEKLYKEILFNLYNTTKK